MKIAYAFNKLLMHSVSSQKSISSLSTFQSRLPQPQADYLFVFVGNKNNRLIWPGVFISLC